MSYSGGYYLFSEPVVRGYGPNSHTAKDLSNLSHYTIDAINHLQDTPWMVNPYMLKTLNDFIDLGADVRKEVKGNMEPILVLERPIDPRQDADNVIHLRFSKEDWMEMSKEQKQGFTSTKARIMATFEEEVGVYQATSRILHLANEMGQFDKFYYPHNADFRLRLYPIPNDLTPQSNDLSKGLLRFARGSRLGVDGLFWMGVSVASQFGKDKLSMDDRFSYAIDMLTNSDIRLWVADPITNRGWLTADSPFQFLAVAQEWVAAHSSPDKPEAFMSHLPGNLDGSCNGAQHLSIMSRDTVGARATNCYTSDTREDLYLEVGNRVWAVVERDAKAGNLVAIEWVPKLMEAKDRRDVVKRSVMTVPYGVTSYGVANFMIDDKHVAEQANNKWDSAKYLRDIILDAIDNSLERGRALQLWFQACADKCAKAGLPMCWDTPAGSKVTQAYRNIIVKRIRAYGTRFVVYEEPNEDEEESDYYKRIGMNVKKMGTSAPPNVVHSCDAAHMQITVCRMAEAGVRDFSMIHDSYGCPFSQVSLMRDILRQSVVDMYANNYLETFKKSVETYSGLTMPPAPELGEFDINEILTSEYFFS
jgi:DNA-directed RNA polymerase